MRGIWRVNHRLRGIEVVFQQSPFQDVRTLLSRNGFRYSYAKSLWWHKDQQDIREIASQVADFVESDTPNKQITTITIDVDPERDEIMVAFSRYHSDDNDKRVELYQANFRYQAGQRKWVAKRNESSMAALQKIVEWMGSKNVHVRDDRESVQFREKLESDESTQTGGIEHGEHNSATNKNRVNRTEPLEDIPSQDVSGVRRDRSTDGSPSRSTTQHREGAGGNEGTVATTSSFGGLDGRGGQTSASYLDSADSLGDGQRNDLVADGGRRSELEPVLSDRTIKRHRKNRALFEFESGEMVYYEGQKVEFRSYTEVSKAMIRFETEDGIGDVKTVDVEKLVADPLEEITLFDFVAEESTKVNDTPLPTRTTPKEIIDFRLSDELDQLGGDKTKYKQNLLALQTLHYIEREQRTPTEEEKKILSRYVGWGGLASAFDPSNQTWAKEYQELRQLVSTGIMTQEEYEMARRSTLHAHYTSATVVQSMYQILERMGFTGGNILEPSMGIGNFFGLMPEVMAGRSDRTGVEIDPLSGRMAQLLYPQATVHIKGFEELKVANGTYDLAIGNVPFGDIRVVDGTYTGKQEFVKNQIHNYFFAKALDKVRDGGIVMFITSTGTLNAHGNQRMREHLASRADFMGAIRLPNHAFKANAGTEVTSDILVLQKRSATEEPRHVASFVNLVDTDIIGRDGSRLKDNEYFVQHPHMVLGMYVEDKLYGNRLGVESDGSDLQQALSEVTPFFPDKMYQENRKTQQVRRERRPISPVVFPDEQLDEANYSVIEGIIYQKVNGNMLPIVVGTNKERIIGLVQIRDAAEKVIQLQREGADDPSVEEAQTVLNHVYDQFVRVYGIVNEPTNIKAFKDDIMGSSLVRALEKNVQQEKRGRKTVYRAEKESIFTERTIQPSRKIERVDTPQEALIISLFEKGKVDFDFIADMMDTNQNEVREQLKGLVFENPATRRWETADEYLSGNVREKLRIAQQTASEEERFAEHVTALTTVQPEDLTAGQITVRLGAPWIPLDDVEAFIHDLLGVQNQVEVSYQPFLATWSVNERNKMFTLFHNTRNTEEYGVKNPRGRNITALDIIEDALNLKNTTITYRDDESDRQVVDAERTNEARAKQRQMQELFQDWLWSEEERATRLVKRYNEEFNSIRLREYDGEAIYGKETDHNITIPGLNRKYQLRSHQKNAVWRMTQGGNTLLAHVVGAGKTLEMIVAGMEMKRLGLISKPMYVVPNHLLDQWGQDFTEAYPGVKLLKISNEGIPSVGVRRMRGMSEADYRQRVEENRAKRRMALQKIVVGTHDAILMTHSTFQKLPMSPETIRQHIREQVEEVETALLHAREEGSRPSVKMLEKAKTNLEAQLKDNLEEEKKDVAIPFEDLGIDQMFVDEAHLFKNLKFHTKMTRVAGLPQTNSKRAQDMFIKTQWLTQKYKGRGVVFATGTPISNTMAEMYTMQRYLQQDTLRQKGISHFDSWAALFGETVVGIEMDATGRFKQKTRFSRFHNVAELMQMFRSFADIKTADMLSLPVPTNIHRETIVADMSEEQRSYVSELAERAKAIQEGRVEPHEDNYLKLTSDGRKIALDPRLVDPSVSFDNPDSKVNECVRKVHKIWEQTESEHLTQLVFLDLSTPKRQEAKEEEKEEPLQGNDEPVEEFTQVYDDIKTKLIRKGVSVSEIAFIHDAKTDKQRLDLFDKVRRGDIRVLLGSTEKMGAGMNVQTKLKALHHLDAPWRPSDVEQREGRIIRQGNQNDSIDIYTYTTEGSFDAIMWDTLKRKAMFIAQVMNGTAQVRSLEDVEELVLGYAQVAAVTSGNPLFMEKHEVDQNVLELQSLKTSYERNKRKYQGEIICIPQDIRLLEEKVSSLKKDLATRKETKGDWFEIEIKGVTYPERSEAGEILVSLYNQNIDQMNHGKMEAIGHFAGFKLFMAKGMAYTHFLKGETTRGFDMSKNPVGMIQKLEHCVRKIEEEIVGREEKIQRSQIRFEDLQRLVTKPFDQEGELKAALQKQAELLKKLTELDGNPVAVEDEPEKKISLEATRKKTLYEIMTDLGKADILSRKAAHHANQIVDQYRVENQGGRKLLHYTLENENLEHSILLEVGRWQDRRRDFSR